MSVLILLYCSEYNFLRALAFNGNCWNCFGCSVGYYQIIVGYRFREPFRDISLNFLRIDAGFVSILLF